MTLKPGLYIVSTPIGNLDDITIRAIETLRNSDIVLCEDTRISQKLLSKHALKCKLQLYTDHSDEKNRKGICELIDQGKSISLISDAGTPLIADPGYKLVRELISAGYFVDIIPGVSSPIAALTLSGMPSDRFLFAGFVPKTEVKRRMFFSELINVKATLIFFDTAIRIQDTLAVALQIFGNREACITRELTKLYQEAKVGTISTLQKYYKSYPPKGEIVILISRSPEVIDLEILMENLEKIIREQLLLGQSARNITEFISNSSKFHQFLDKKTIYRIVNKIKNTEIM